MTYIRSRKHSTSRYLNAHAATKTAATLVALACAGIWTTFIAAALTAMDSAR